MQQVSVISVEAAVCLEGDPVGSGGDAVVYARLARLSAGEPGRPACGEYQGDHTTADISLY